VTQKVKTRDFFFRGARGVLLAALSLSPFVSASACSSDPKKPAEEQAPGGAGSEPQSSGRFTACDDSSQCDEEHGFSCVDGECTYACESHSDCREVGHCASRIAHGKRQQFCVRDPKPPEVGGLYTPCPQGDECADPRLCIGAGPGDLDAYCSVDCSSDDDCAAGYYCGTMTRRPCEAACKQDAAPSDPSCVPSDEIGKGKAFYCNALGGVERKVCRQREFCAPCNDDSDCLSVPNQICARGAAGDKTKICTRLCDPDTRSCPWGNAAECAVFDEELGEPTCAHRFGSCSGSGKTCEPCVTNDDCPGGACTSSQFTGERWCIDLQTKCECKEGVDSTGTCTDGGCPDSPSGLTVQCVGEGSTLSGICFAANCGTDTLLGTSPQTGCWPPP